MSTQKFGRYPQYRESGDLWLGEIPAHWGLKPLKHLCSFAGGSTPAKENRRYWDGGTIPWVSPKDMKVFCLSETQDQITEIAVKESSVSIISPGALLMVVRSGILQRTIPVAINSVSVTLNQDMKALTFSGPKGAEYFAYLVQGNVSALLQRWTKEGATVESVEHEFLANDSVPDVPIDERCAIVEFLDYETAKIDALIEKQQQLITLLKEKRQAVISHAVTKGLNPDAPMRDSGVEWLGEVPAHWTVGKCGFYLSMLSGFAFPSSGFSDAENDVRLLRGINVAVSKIRWEEVVRWRRVCGDGLDPYEMAVDDLVLGMDRPLISEGVRVAKIGPDDIPCLLLQRVTRLKTGNRLSSDYLMHLLSSDMFEAHFSPETTGVSVPHISPSQIANFMIPIPPIDEQNEIVTQLDTMTRKLDGLALRAREAEELLQERRTALISAAVTGKIDVRGWKPPESKPLTEAA